MFKLYILELQCFVKYTGLCQYKSHKILVVILMKLAQL